MSARITYATVVACAVYAVLLFGVAGSNAGAFELIKTASSDTVYFLDEDGVRHPFPNRTTYESWYGSDFARVVTVSDAFMATFSLGSNITMRSGIWPIKIPSRPEVYAVEPGGVLRHLDNEEIAEFLYGTQWRSKVRDIPEVFFDNYTIGDPIDDIRTIPEGIVYKLSGEDALYWKNNGVLEPFASETVVRENGYDPAHAVVADKIFSVIDSMIDVKSKRVFNPTLPANTPTYDCETEKLKAAFIYLYKGELDDDELAKVLRYQKELPAYWQSITENFSSIDASFPLYLLKDDGQYTVRNEYGRDNVKNEAVFTFYEDANDIFDFVIIFTDFPVGKKNEATYQPITNYISGIGKLRLNRASLFGSHGKLKGLITMGDTKNFSIDTKRLLDSALNGISHEILHHWSGALYYIDEDGKLNNGLLAEDLVHWSPWVDFASPLGGFSWHETEDGRYASDTELANDLRRRLAPLDLYAMGFYPAQVIEPVHYIDTVLSEPATLTVDGILREATIEQIIEANGKRKCNLPS